MRFWFLLGFFNPSVRIFKKPLAGYFAMKVSELSIAEQAKKVLSGIDELRPAQEKAVRAGLLDGMSLLICTPTASGKTLIAELAAVKTILEHKQKVVYIVPLVALAQEKYREFKARYAGLFNVALSIGDYDSADGRLIDQDLIITTSEKLDSLIRHHAPWIMYVKTLIIDEIHLLNDVSRGPTLEILITLLKRMLSNVQIIGLSATIGNPEDLAEWMGAVCVKDLWRPVPLHQGILVGNEIEFRNRK
ncbi:DEAD/DEAH box helicase [Candidatus Woesearchaeota archaeon]|nr:DEAD/DEAH box helicase [Candidatus Woesearchaeota archaeon]